ncbi:hypothetical protein GCM10009546_50210 [Actinomadura livida]|uniref:Uncharacterized protein n=1 Tax=Actinomadura livida TaxID=79909 RepID=A0ABN1F4N2_9ACTN|nr:hypothetical protein GCM10010208_52340 [Actinomadura livida]
MPGEDDPPLRTAAQLAVLGELRQPPFHPGHPRGSAHALLMIEPHRSVTLPRAERFAETRPRRHPLGGAAGGPGEMDHTSGGGRARPGPFEVTGHGPGLSVSDNHPGKEGP